MSEAGRPTELDNELCLKIRALVLEGKNLLEIATECEIAYKTMEAWKTRNYQGFADKMIQYKNEWRLSKSEENIDEILGMEVKELVLEPGATISTVFRDENGKIIKTTNPRLLTIKADMSKFVAETLGKKTYSKRSELSGVDGKDLIPVSPETKEKINKALDEFINSRNPAQ